MIGLGGEKVRNWFCCSVDLVCHCWFLRSFVSSDVCSMREDEERRLADYLEQHAVELAEQEERQRQRDEFNKGLHMEAAQLKFNRELTRAFTFSYMQLMHTLGLKASAQKPHESESRLYQT